MQDDVSLLFPIYQTSLCSYVSAVQQSFENALGEGEIARNEQFLLFPHCFLSFCRTFRHLHEKKDCSLQTPLDFKSPKFVVPERVIKEYGFEQESIIVIIIIIITCNKR